MLPVVRLPGMVPDALRHGVVAIGNFDGVHLGHRAVLAQARAQATARNAPLLALTFEPHPREFFQPDLAPWGIFPLAERLRLLEEAGVDGVLLQRFDTAFAAMSAQSFAQHLLAETVAARLVVTGADFVFGQGRQGNAQRLQGWLSASDVGYEACAAAMLKGEAVSSTRIRQALAEGAMEMAARLLGRAYASRGPVLHGNKLGRTLGYPTANLALTPRRAPRHGIYIAWGRVEQEAWWPAVISFGMRPTFDNGPPLVEAHRLDAPEKYSIYDQELELAWGPFLRREARFEDAAALVAQMDRDKAQAQAFHERYAHPEDWLSHLSPSA